jgi:hypothetical protein
MSTFSLNASGFLGDITVVEHLFDDLKALLGKPEYGVTQSQFTGLGKWENNFHQAADPATGEASAQTSAQAAPGAEDADTGDAAAPPAASDNVGAGGDTETAPSE